MHITIHTYRRAEQVNIVEANPFLFVSSVGNYPCQQRQKRIVEGEMSDRIESKINESESVTQLYLARLEERTARLFSSRAGRTIRSLFHLRRDSLLLLDFSRSVREICLEE